MKTQFRYIALVIISIIVTGLASMPLIIYHRKFGDSQFSDPEKWGVFGDFIGGIYNPIISLASLFVLGYLTHVVAKQSNDENRNLLLLERRMNAYDELAKFIKATNSMTTDFNYAMSLLPVYTTLPREQALLHTIKIYEELKATSKVFHDLYFTLHEFFPRYGHLFKYDFKSNEYKELLIESKRVGEMMYEIVADFNKIKNMTAEQRDLTKLRDLMIPVIIAIRKEVEPIGK